MLRNNEFVLDAEKSVKWHTCFWYCMFDMISLISINRLIIICHNFTRSMIECEFVWIDCFSQFIHLERVFTTVLYITGMFE